MKGCVNMKTHSVKGVICAKDQYNIEYALCYIEQIYYEDDSFEYVFRPYYNMIELCNDSFFQGIPGINLDMKKKEYIRENKTPTFIYERTPQENREDLWTLLEEVNLEYLDKLEWLIRSKREYTGDSLFVKRFSDSESRNNINEIHYQDTIVIDNIRMLGRTIYQKTKKILEIITSGANLTTKEFTVNDYNRQAIYDVMYSLYKIDYQKRRKKQLDGVQSALSEDKYKGRKRIPVELPKLAEVFDMFDQKKISEKEAMKKLGLTSRSTFYRRIKEFRNSR